MLKISDYQSKAAGCHNGPYEFVQRVGEAITLKCRDHGEFSMSMSSFRNGAGCKQCDQCRKAEKRDAKWAAAREELIQEFLVIHDGKYTYDNFHPHRLNSDITVTCRIHGDFVQSLYNHKKGHGCIKCAAVERGISRRENYPKLSDEELLARRRESSKRFYKNNPEKAKAYRERMKEWSKEYKKSYYQANKAKVIAAARSYAEKHPDRIAATRKAYRAHRWDQESDDVRVKQATPKWADLSAISAVYEECARVTKETGIPHSVDHVEPLRGYDRCGLHVANNLRIITKEENTYKGNRAGDVTRRQYWEQFTEEQIDTYARGLLERFRKEGFPYYDKPSSSLIARSVVVSQIYLGKLDPDSPLKATDHGTTIANAFFPHMFSVKCGKNKTPEEVYWDDTMFLKAIKTSLGRNDYVSTRAIRTAVSIYGGARLAANFHPMVAAMLYSRYAPENAVVYDPCAGWGGRLYGAAIAGVRKYIGVDASSLTVQGLNELGYNLTPFVSSEFYHAGSEYFIPQEPIDMVLTSPPYFDHEKYCNDQEQSYVKFPTTSDWMQGFFEPMVQNCLSVLAEDGVFALNLADVPSFPSLTSEAVLAMVKLGFQHEETLQMPLKSINSERGRRYEPIFIFRKA